MRRGLLLFLVPLLLPLASLAACGETNVTPEGAGGQASGSGGSASGSDLPCDVEELLAGRCQTCHATDPLYGAPMPLVGYGDLVAAPRDGQGTIAERAVARMIGADGSRMPPPPDAPATQAEIDLLQGWIDAGYPKRAAGESCGTGGGGAGGGSGVDCEPDINLGAPQPFEMPATSKDEQVCFGIDVPASEVKRHITAIAPRIDNAKIVHHMLLLQAPSSVSPEPTPCNFTAPEWKLLYAWGPGTPPHELPPEAGFPMNGGDTIHFVMQVHYNNLNGLEGEADQSGLDLCTTTELRDYDADVVAFGGLFDQSIAPNATSAATCSTPIPTELGPYLPLNVYQAWPHMHQIGQELHSWIERGGQSIPIVDVDDYDFEYQVTYPVDLALQAGDTVHTTCVWNNNTPDAKSFGEGTEDEMCFNFLTYYPRIEGNFWNWLLPAYSASCDMQVQ